MHLSPKNLEIMFKKLLSDISDNMITTNALNFLAELDKI